MYKSYSTKNTKLQTYKSSVVHIKVNLLRTLEKVFNPNYFSSTFKQKKNFSLVTTMRTHHFFLHLSLSLFLSLSHTHTHKHSPMTHTYLYSLYSIPPFLMCSITDWIHCQYHSIELLTSLQHTQTAVFQFLST